MSIAAPSTPLHPPPTPQPKKPSRNNFVRASF